MKSLVGIFIVIINFISQISFAQDVSPWEGSFVGSILGTNAFLNGQLAGTQWTGTINVKESPWQPDEVAMDDATTIVLEGTINGEECTGTWRDEGSQRSTHFTATSYSGQITVFIHELNPIVGYEEDMYFTFSRNTGPPSVGTYTPSSNVKKFDDGTAIDQDLLGMWWYATESLNKGFIINTDYYLQFNDNGTLFISGGRDGSLDFPSALHEQDSDIEVVNWKTEKQVIWIQDDAGGWQPYARYNEDGGTLLLVYTKGKKQVWERF